MARARAKKAEPESENHLHATLLQAQERYGDVVSTGQKKKQPVRISTGVFFLDFCLMGGIPEGRSTMLVGERSSGKSSLASKIIANAQIEYPDKEVVLMDVEHTYDAVWGEKLGIDNEKLHVLTTDTGEQGVDMIDAVLSAPEVSLLVIDSLPMMIPMAEAKASAEDQHMGRQARLFNELARKVTNTTNHMRAKGHHPTTLMLNQYRTNIGQMFGDNRTVSGGRAIEHVNSIILSLKNKETVERDEYGIERVSYNEHSFNITKNKVCNGPREGAFRLVRDSDVVPGLYEGDIDNATTMLTYAKKFGLWTGKGKGQKLQFRDYDLKFNTQDAGILAMNEDADLYYALYFELLKLQAIQRGMPTDFIARFE